MRLFKLIFFILLLSAGGETFAQNSRIAIANLLDSNLIYKHIGLTAFKDKSDTFDCQFNCKQYIDQELTRILSKKYSVSFLSIPNSLLPFKANISNLLKNAKRERS